MNKQRKYLASIAVVVLVVGFVYWLFAEEASHIPPATVTEENAAPPLSYIGNSIQEEKNGKKIWELNAEFIEVDQKTKNMLMKNIKGTFYQADNKTVTIEAPRAIYDVTNKNVMLSDGVQATSSDGAVLNADEVIFDRDKEIFNGNGHVKLTRGDTIMTGDKLEAFEAFSKFRVTGNAHILKGGQDS